LLAGLVVSIDPKPSPSLRIMTYNIRHGRGMDGKVDLERIAAVIARERPDVVALQEVDRECLRSGGVDMAARLGELLGMDSRFAGFMPFQEGAYGMAVLSRLPIHQTRVHALPAGQEPRVALEVEVELARDIGVLSVVGIHHDWTREAFRIAQMKAVLDSVQDRSHPVLLAGDFNAPRTAPTMQMLERESWTIAGIGDAGTYPSGEPKEEIDFIVWRGNGLKVSHRVVDETQASDHRPVVVEFSGF
jgi:endonuclease/exonuclease/phosphatase family metal-dependent hydrolase